KDVAPGFGGAGSTANVGGISQGDGYLIGVDYLIPGKVGWGQFQPFFRYQEFNADLNHTTADQYDLGVNYVIDGHNARVSLDYSKNEGGGVPDFDRFIVGIQLQF
ncbi:MAG TPA: porin, partial [Alphaproteobacteria bacterium]|nr:porin [Alphaproteobacteria bacterium]